MALVYLTNSYLESADDYLADVPDWEAATDDVKEQALVDATTILDEHPWIGSAVSETQSLAWPRSTDAFFDPVLNLYVPVSTDTVPIRVQKATAYLALHLVRYPEAVTANYDQKYNSISVGPISLANSSSAQKPPRMPTQVKTLIEPLLQPGRAATTWWRAQ